MEAQTSLLEISQSQYTTITFSFLSHSSRPAPVSASGTFTQFIKANITVSLR